MNEHANMIDTCRRTVLIMFLFQDLFHFNLLKCCLHFQFPGFLYFWMTSELFTCCVSFRAYCMFFCCCQGYLDLVLSRQLGYEVLGLENQSGRASGAGKRADTASEKKGTGFLSIVYVSVLRV